MASPCLALESKPAKGKKYAPPGFEESIQEFERKDKGNFPPLGEIVVIGSSQIRRWDTIAEDFAPLTVIHRGYGGSTYNDALHYAERIVIPYKPRAILIYAGGNDLAQVDPETVRDTFRAFVEKVRAQIPEVRIYVLSIIPTILQVDEWPLQKETNRLIREYCAGDNRLVFIDLASGVLDADGKPRKDIFDTDDLHINRNGYIIWRDIIMPVLLKNEDPY